MRLIQPINAVHRFPFGWLYELAVSDPDRVEGALEFSFPVLQKGFKAGE